MEELAALVEELDLDVDLDDDEIEELDLEGKGLAAIPSCVFALTDLTTLALEGKKTFS